MSKQAENYKEWVNKLGKDIRYTTENGELFSISEYVESLNKELKFTNAKLQLTLEDREFWINQYNRILKLCEAFCDRNNQLREQLKK